MGPGHKLENLMRGAADHLNGDIALQDLQGTVKNLGDIADGSHSTTKLQNLRHQVEEELVESEYWLPRDLLVEDFGPIAYRPMEGIAHKDVALQNL